jgi:hypothetical protein
MNLKEKLIEICSNIKTAQERSGYDHPVEIVGVTKTHPFSYIEESYRVGLRSIGENRVQEAEEKFGTFEKMPKLRKRFIGHLQSNKVKRCLDIFDTIDSVDSLKTLRKISRYAINRNKEVSVLIEVNTSKEAQKNGFLLSQKEDVAQCFLEDRVSVSGLMTIAPNTSDQDEIRQSFRALKELRSWLIDNKNIKVSHLSMGMSGDYEIAVEEGSTMIRVGSLLYGSRNND